MEIMNAFLHRVAWNAQSAALILNGNGAIQDPSLKSIGRTVSHHHQGLYQITSCEGCVCFPEDGRGEATCEISLNLVSSNGDHIIGGIANRGCIIAGGMWLFLWVFDQGHVPHLRFPPQEMDLFGS